MTKPLVRLVCYLCLFSFLISCDSARIYEENIDLPDSNWKIADVKEFTFQIKDTDKTYQVYFNIRNALSYEYYNLYLKEALIAPDGQKIHSKLHEMYLMDKKTGEPLGSGTGDILDHSVLALPNQKFTKPGNYTIRLTQYMRKNPLPGILSVGIKVVSTE